MFVCLREREIKSERKKQRVKEREREREIIIEKQNVSNKILYRVLVQ